MLQNIIQRAIAKVIPTAVKSGLYNNLATFQSSDAADFPDGFYSNEFVDLPGLALLQCMAAPEDTSYIQATEVKQLADIMASELLHVSFTRFFMTLDAGWRQGWRVVIGNNDGNGAMVNPVNYDLLGVGVDSQSQHSVCKVRLTTI